jgi:aryl-alcohol dehydrogenase-like predicted oxidoreductase
MRTRRFGRTGWQVSDVGYGLWGMGGWSDSDDEESIAALERAIALGVTFFDTALAYGKGRSERLLGQVLAAHRDTPLIVATKVPPKNSGWPALAEYHPNDVFPADYVRASTETSLENLGLASVDLQQFHVWHDAWATDDRWHRMVDDLKREGLARAVGISLNRWEPKNGIAALRTGLFDSVQVVYNLFDQDPEDELFPVCRELDIAVIARVPFDEGSLTGTMTRDMTWPEGDWRNLYFPPDRLGAILDRVDEVRTDLQPGEPMAEFALRFILSNPDVSTVIPGMRKTRHVAANAEASEAGGLPSDRVARLRRHRWKRTYIVV